MAKTATPFDFFVMMLPPRKNWLRIKRPIYQALLDHLLALAPHEGCGLLAGHWATQTVTTLYVIENQADQPTIQFLMNPQMQLDAFVELETAVLDLLAIYHSHPQGPDHPSATDMAHTHYPQVIQIIVSLTPPQPKLRAFWVTKFDFSEIALRIE